MRSLMMTGPSRGVDRTVIREIEEPRPGPGQVTVGVAHAGINFVDVMARRGDAGYGGTWPYAPGVEVSGVVREVGPGVTDLTVGQRVAAFTAGGGLAEVALARAAHTVPVPDRVPSAVAAAAPLMLTTALLLLCDAARFRPGETVLMHSASGGVGSAVAQLVQALGGGLRIGTVGRPGKVASALKSGYDVAVTRSEDLAEAVRAATGGAGADIVLDPLGTAMLETDLALTAPGGRIVLFGNAGGGEQAPLPPAGRLIGGNLAISGFSVSGLWATAPHRASAGLRRVLDLIAEGRLDITPTEVGSLADVPAVHQLLAEGRGDGKYVARLQG
ncbi:quinone oxidoreductase family protein [Planotetraspora kaengkrachanensis]|uniref:NADPH:quinone reductase n=1 Tax=Planotetraspora kaengkrachanensis TaxID=575193 RepID=A0A8J3VBA4_9ACTN|nr:zinc-binding dehydrogenase [Planotetraspora kaengkrachanensis]GIG84655.1 NADPH:quinone reductase [Planotetraspora kaengkrachanensis]